MPHKNKKFFTKDNSVKFLLLRGNDKATNADGETLPSVFVPVSKNYKPGTSLLMSNMAAFCNLEENEDPTKKPDLEKIMDQFEYDSESEDYKIEELPSKMKCLTMKQKEKLLNDDDDNCCSGDSNFDVDSQFSDFLEGSYEDVDFKHSATHIDYDGPENLKILSGQLDKVLEEYDEEQIGALDDDEICGHLSTDCEIAQHLLDGGSFNETDEPIVLGPCDETMKEKILNYAENPEEEKMVEIVIKKPVEFDCESILSTYSNKYNHPTIIKEEKVKKIKVSNNPLKKTLTKSQLKTLDCDHESDTESDDNLSVSTRFNVRVKGETPEEKRERKQLFKEAKKESRMMKKENKLAFKREKKVQTVQNLNKQRNAGMKLL